MRRALNKEAVVTAGAVRDGSPSLQVGDSLLFRFQFAVAFKAV